MVRKGTIDARAIGELYKRTKFSERRIEYEEDNLRKIRMVLLWDGVPKGRSVMFWRHQTIESGLVTAIPTADFQALDLTIIGCIYGRKSARFRVDAVYGTAPDMTLQYQDYVALIKIIKERLQEEFPDKQIQSFTKDVISIEEQAPWEF